MIEHFNFRQVLIWFPAAKYQEFILVLLKITPLGKLLDVRKREHNETSFGLELCILGQSDLLPPKWFLSKIKALDGGESLAALGSERDVWAVHIDEPLEGVQISLVLGNEGAGISSLLVHRWHRGPFVVENVELLACTDHCIFFVASSDNINISILKVVVSRKTGPTLRYWR
jgi:hypothetical protein